MQAKAIGWDSTFAFCISQDAIERTGEKDGIIKAFRTWQEAREAGVFTRQMKEKLQNPDCKFHIERKSEKAFIVYTVKENRISDKAGAEVKPIAVTNPYDKQPLQFSLQVAGVVDACVVTLPDGSNITCAQKMAPNQFIICKGDNAYLADNNRKQIADLPMAKPAVFAKGEATLGVQFPKNANVGFNLTVWGLDKGEPLGQ